jgi:uncharacterized protein YqcC (DUF446 family)
MTAADEERLNAENFELAVRSLRENEPMWASQLEMMLGHPVKITLDFASLEGRFERVRPFIHQGLSAVLEGLGRLLLDRDTWAPFFAMIRRVRIAGAAEDAQCTATLSNGTLSVRVPLKVADIAPPTHDVVNAYRALIGLAPAPVPAPYVPPALPVFDGDPYAYAAQFIVALEASMRATGLWPGPQPAGEIVVEGAFGSRNMPFEHWLAWVLIPRVASIVETRDAFPGASNVAAYAVRALDGAGADEVIDVLRAFDDVITGLPRDEDA